MFFYELHEGDDEIYSDILLARDDELEPEEFFELVQSIRRRVQDSYVDDTLIEAIAIELERDHGFVFISDDRLSAAVNVSSEESENFLTEIDRDEDREDREDIGDDAEDEEAVDYRAVVAEFDPDGGTGRAH